MEDLQDKIIELMDLFDDEQVTTADKIDRPERALEKQAIDDFMKRNPMAGGGMLVQPSVDGSRPGYAKAKKKIKGFPNLIIGDKEKALVASKAAAEKKLGTSTRFSLPELNRISRIKFGKNFKDLASKKERDRVFSALVFRQKQKLKGKDVKPVTKKTSRSPFPKDKQTKIKNYFPDADFEKYPRFGYSKDSAEYRRILAFVDRGFKPVFKEIPKSVQELIKNKFTDIKNWDFKKFRYGVPPSEAGSQQWQRIRTFVSEPKPDLFAFDYRKPGGWMITQMERAWRHGNPDYDIITRDPNKPPSVDNKIIGIKEKGKAYYANENVAPSKNFRLINSHPEFNSVQKFVDIANEAKLPLKDLTGYGNTKALLKLFPEGYESIKLSELVRFVYDIQGVDVTKNAIEKHHIKTLSDMGAPVDSKNLQLLRRDLNVLANTIGNEVKAGDLSRIPELERAGVKITIDGKTYGKGFQDPRRQFNRIIGDVTQKVSSLDKTQLDDLLLKLSGQIDRDCAGAIKQASKDGGRIGLQTIGSREVCITKAKNYARDQVAKGIPDTGVKGSLIKRIFKSTSDFVKSALDPKELFDIKKQFFSKGAIASLPIFDAGIAGYEALAMNKPVKEAISDTFTFGSIPRAMGIGMDRSEVIQAKNLLNNPNLSPAGKEYAQLIIDLGEYENLQRDATPLGITRKFNKFNELQNKIKNASTAGKFDYQSLLNETQATQLAKDEYSPLIGSLGDPLKNRATVERTGTRQGKGPVKIDLSPITYKNFEANIPPKEEFDEYLRSKNLIGQDQELTEEEYQRSFYKPAEFEQLMETPGFKGTQDRFATGGRAGFKLGDIVRKGVLKLIDDTVKSTPKDTTSTLDKLIKKTLNEDFLDKKDTIIDTLNAKIARERKNFPYNQQVFEEPSQLDFYDAITKSNFRTKTGPFFDYQKRKNKAGGGLLKQAGDRSGAMLESMNPDSQGLQGLLNRVKKI